MITRPLYEKDFADVLALEEATQSALLPLAAFERCWEAGFPGWVVEEGHRIIAFAILSLALGECHVLNLCVHPDKQRQGIGRELLVSIIDWAKSQGAMMAYLEVRRSNVGAVELYRQMKFKLIGERKNYYPAREGKEDALVFARDLGIE